jgi:flagellar capping protein FliD
MPNTIGQLDPYFTRLVSSLMTIERQPLERITAQRDEISVRRGAYTDLTGYLRELQGLAKNLISTSAFYSLKPGRSASVAPVQADTAVLTASAGAQAIPGAYQVSVTRLATAHQVRSSQQPTADQPLGLAGTLRLGAAAARQLGVSATAGTPVSQFGLAEPAAGQSELGTSTYYVETRQDGGVWQFRLVNAEGQAVSLRASDGSGYSTGWQPVPATGTPYDTGRGLVLTFGSLPIQPQSWQSGAASVAYTPQGAAIEVTALDSLNTLASAINNAAYPEGNAVSATVVDRQLVLTARHTGQSYTVRAADEAGSVLSALGVLDGVTFAHATPGVDAAFSLNGIPVTRSQNTGLADVITGVTLNLAADAEGRAATLTVSQDTTAPRQALEDFVAKFNHVLTYLQAKTEIASVTTGETTTYTRGTLAGASLFNDLRTDLLSRFMSPVTNTGRFASLRAVGLAIDDNLQASLADASLLESALRSNPGDLALLLDALMTNLDTHLNRFTQTNTGYLERAVGTLDVEIKEANAQLVDWTGRLADRELYLNDQFSAVQAQLMALTYMQQQWQTIYNAYG